MSVFEDQSTIQSWDDDYYHPIAERFYDRAISDMLALLNPEPGELILDAGCGPGNHSIRVVRNGYRVCAADISRSMLDEAKRRVAQALVSRDVVFRQEDLTRLSFDKDSVSHAFSWGVIIHIPEVDKALSELARVLTRKGRLALYISNRDALDHKIENIARKVLRKPLDRTQHALGTRIWYQMHGHPLCVWLFDIPSLVAYMEGLGLRLLHRKAGEFSEFQRRLPSPLRVPSLWMNNLYYSADLPASLAVANLLVFEKD